MMGAGTDAVCPGCNKPGKQIESNGVQYIGCCSCNGRGPNSAFVYRPSLAMKQSNQTHESKCLVMKQTNTVADMPRSSIQKSAWCFSENGATSLSAQACFFGMLAPMKNNPKPSSLFDNESKECMVCKNRGTVQRTIHDADIARRLPATLDGNRHLMAVAIVPCPRCHGENETNRVFELVKKTYEVEKSRNLTTKQTYTVADEPRPDCRSDWWIEGRIPLCQTRQPNHLTSDV